MPEQKSFPFMRQPDIYPDDKLGASRRVKKFSKLQTVKAPVEQNQKVRERDRREMRDFRAEIVFEGETREFLFSARDVEEAREIARFQLSKDYWGESQDTIEKIINIDSRKITIFDMETGKMCEE